VPARSRIAETGSADDSGPIHLPDRGLAAVELSRRKSSDELRRCGAIYTA